MPMDLGTSSSDYREGNAAMKKLPIASAASLTAQQPFLSTTAKDQEMLLPPVDKETTAPRSAADEGQKPPVYLVASQTEQPAPEEQPVAVEEHDAEAAVAVEHHQSQPVRFAIPSEMALVPSEPNNVSLMADMYGNRSAVHVWASRLTDAFGQRLFWNPSDVALAGKLDDIIEAGHRLSDLFYAHALFADCGASAFVFFKTNFSFPGVVMTNHLKDTDATISGTALELVKEIATNSADGTSRGDNVLAMCHAWEDQFAPQSHLFLAWSASSIGESKHHLLLPSFDNVIEYLSSASTH